MNRTINDIRNLLLTLISMAAMAMAAMSCVNDYADCPDNAAASRPSRYRLQFQIVTRTSPQSRAADIDGDQEGSVAENYLNVRNIKYFIFDSAGNFLADVTPDTETVAANESFTIYNVVSEVEIPYFIQHVDDVLDFYILAVANYSGWGLTLPALNEGDNISTLFNNGLTLTYRPATPALMLAGTPGVSATETQYFPMVGLQHFSVNGSMLGLSSDGSPYDISLASGKRLNMLRAMAKIEIIDRIDIAPGAVFDPETDSKGIRIKSANINGFMSRARLLPSISNWQRNSTFETQQVINTSMPSPFDYHVPPLFVNNRTIGNTAGYSDYQMPFSYDAVATSRRADKCPVYSCYVYEYSQMAISSTYGVDQQPYFTIDIARYVDPATGEELVEEMTDIPMRMAAYTNGATSSAQNLPYLLRNHIYRFEVTAFSQQIEANWTVCPMDQAEANIEFN